MNMELFNTKSNAFDMAADHFVQVPKAGTKGMRILVKQFQMTLYEAIQAGEWCDVSRYVIKIIAERKWLSGYNSNFM